MLRDHGPAGATCDHPLEIQELGVLPLPTGRLVACDPYLLAADARPLQQPLPPGDYPVLAAWALVSPERPRNAAAVLVLGSAPITSWSMSRTEDPPSADREPEPPPAEEGLTAFTGYAVEAGTGALLGQRRACPRRG